MVFVILGTQDKPFYRLLESVDRQIFLRNIKGDVIVQAGCTKYQSDNMKIYDLIPMNEFKNYIKSADYIITHGGVGAILDSLKMNKKVIASPRLSEFGEHVNDHQKQIIDEFADLGYIIKCDDLDNLSEAIALIDNFKPKKYESNNEKFVNLISDYIDAL